MRTVTLSHFFTYTLSLIKTQMKTDSLRIIIMDHHSQNTVFSEFHAVLVRLFYECLMFALEYETPAQAVAGSIFWAFRTLKSKEI